MTETLKAIMRKLRFQRGDNEPTPLNIAIEAGYNAALDDVLSALAGIARPSPSEQLDDPQTCEGCGKDVERREMRVTADEVELCQPCFDAVPERLEELLAAEAVLEALAAEAEDHPSPWEQEMKVMPTERFMRHYYGASGYVAPGFVRRELDVGVFIGGNHLANALIKLGMHPPDWRTSTYEAVTDGFGDTVADVWMCWKAIMDARDSLVPSPSPSKQEQP